MLSCSKVILRCEGLDTLTDIRINGQLIASTNNMHRTYEFDVKDVLKEGENDIHITLYSPTQYISKKHKETPLWGVPEAIPGYPHLRKAHCMFGWDWGPQIPDLGIFRNISIRGYEYGRLDDVYISQNHKDNEVLLDIRVSHTKWDIEDLTVEAVVIGPDGESYSAKIDQCRPTEHIKLSITDPKLWWPNGYGDQPLYQVKVLLKKENDLLDSWEGNIGLRTIEVRREKDQWGESFEFNVNGVSIFAMGADYIPEDSLLPRRSPERTERLWDCVKPI